MNCTDCGGPLLVGPIYVYCKNCRKHTKIQRKLDGFMEAKK